MEIKSLSIRLNCHFVHIALWIQTKVAHISGRSLKIWAMFCEKSQRLYTTKCTQCIHANMYTCKCNRFGAFLNLKKKIWEGGSPCLVRGCRITSSATQPLEQTSLNLFKTGDGNSHILWQKWIILWQAIMLWQNVLLLKEATASVTQAGWQTCCVLSSDNVGYQKLQKYMSTLSFHLFIKTNFQSDRCFHLILTLFQFLKSFKLCLNI